MASAARIRIRTNYTRADGTSQVYLLVIIDRKSQCAAQGCEDAPAPDAGRQHPIRLSLRQVQGGQGGGKWTAAAPREIDLLDACYDTLAGGSARRRHLRRWLFGVATGLRVSNQRRAQLD